MKKIFYSLLFAVALTACGPAENSQTQSLKGNNFEAVMDGVTITMSFDPEKNFAYGAVANRFNAPYEINGNQITFINPITTMMMPFGAAADVEHHFFRFITEIRTFDFDGEILTFKDDAGNEMTFHKVDE